MTQKEIIEFEETNTGVIRLYLEGSFYKAYERSAFAFCTRIKDYRVLRKGKGTLFGIERLEHHIRSCSNNYHRQESLIVFVTV